MAFAAFHKDLKAYAIDHPFFGPAFLRAADLVIRLALTGQQELARPLAAELSPLVQAVAGAAPGTALDLLDRSNVATLALIDLATVMGWPAVPPDAQGRAVAAPLDRLAALTRFGEGMAPGVALALLVHGRADPARAVARAVPLPPFVAACLDGQGASHWPAWRDGFPAATATGQAHWHQLLFAIRLLAPPGADPAAWLRGQLG